MIHCRISTCSILFNYFFSNWHHSYWNMFLMDSNIQVRNSSSILRLFISFFPNWHRTCWNMLLMNSNIQVRKSSSDDAFPLRLSSLVMLHTLTLERHSDARRIVFSSLKTIHHLSIYSPTFFLYASYNCSDASGTKHAHSLYISYRLHIIPCFSFL